MQIIYLNKTGEVRNNKEELERKMNVKMTIVGKKLTIEGEALAEYEAGIVIDAITFGFSAKKALLLTEADNIFRKIHIKHFTRRKNMDEVRARLIGTEGKTRRTLEEVGDCEIIIGEKEVGIIGSAENIDRATTGITNLIKGSKQANVYRYLERVNALNRTRKNKEVNAFNNKKSLTDSEGNSDIAEEEIEDEED